MRQPMLRWRKLRQGAHHVKRLGLSGSSVRPTSARCSPSFSNSSRSSGRCPMRLGWRSFGCTSTSLRVTFMSPHSTSSCPSSCSCLAHAASLGSPASLHSPRVRTNPVHVLGPHFQGLSGFPHGVSPQIGFAMRSVMLRAGAGSRAAGPAGRRQRSIRALS